MLMPQIAVNTVFDVPYEALRTQGVSGLIFDVDNTLVPYEQAEADEALRALFSRLAAMGFWVALLSNNGEQRVALFAKGLELPYVSAAKKPLKSGFHALLARTDIPPKQLAMVGDQVFTDVWGGNRMGMVTVLVDSISPKEGLFCRLKRWAEQPIRTKAKRRT